MFSRIFTIFIFVFICDSRVFARENVCKNIFSYSLKTYMEQPTIERFYNSRQVDLKFQKLRSFLDHAIKNNLLHDGFGFFNPFEVWGEFKQVENKFMIRVPILRVVENNESIDDGKSPSKNLQGIQLFLAVFKMYSYWKHYHPNVNEFFLVASEVSNDKLNSKTLSKLGFVRKSSNRGMEWVLELKEDQ